MARRGETIENPVQGDRISFLATAEDTDGELLRMEMFVSPQASGLTEHVHPRQEERLEVVSGAIRARADGREQSLGAGQSLVVPKGTPHTWWNEGADEARVLVELRPALNTETLVETIYGLARDGKTNNEGVPGLLQVAVMCRSLHRDEIYLARPPVPVQKALYALLAPIGVLLGYKARYPRSKHARRQDNMTQAPIRNSTGTTFRNWNDSASSTPRVVAVPGNLEELIDVVKDTANYPSPLRVGGSFHSLNACFVTDGTQILLTRFDQVRVDINAMTITVGAAVKMFQIRDALRPHGMQTEVMPEIGNATAGSVACCGTKDASLGRSGSGQVTSTVIGVKLVNAEGNAEEITEADHPEKMRAVRSSYGLFGPIFEVTFRIQRRSVLSYSYESFKLTSRPGHDGLFGGADGVLGLLLPYSDRIVVERRRVLPRNAPISRFSRFKRFLRDTLWENGVSFFTTLLPYNWFFRINDALISLTLLGISRFGGFRACRSDSTIDFKFDRGHYFDFTFWAIPVSRWEEFVPEYLAFCRDYLRETGFRVSLLSEVYFINKDRRALLSFSPDEDVFTVDLTDSRPNDPDWIEINRRFNVFAARFGGRPLLNQTKQLSRDVVYQTLGDDWKQLLSYREQRDPGGRFLSKYFEDLM